jgi:polyisoprenoid-binding protein YceI
MQTMKKGNPILTFVFLVTGIFSASSQSFETLKAFSMAVHGTSTLHDWESKVIKGTWAGAITLDEDNSINIQKADLSILVKDIQSEHGRIMDTKTYEAFNADKNPYIKFSMKSVSQNDAQLNMEGTLTMNGNSRSITMILMVKTISDHDIKFSGSYTLKMTDFKMSPPTAMMGTIKVGNEVTIKFDLTLSK